MRVKKGEACVWLQRAVRGAHQVPNVGHRKTARKVGQWDSGTVGQPTHAFAPTAHHNHAVSHTMQRHRTLHAAAHLKCFLRRSSQSCARTR
jgi:hypothetical protein